MTSSDLDELAALEARYAKLQSALAELERDAAEFALLAAAGTLPLDHYKAFEHRQGMVGLEITDILFKLERLLGDVR